MSAAAGAQAASAAAERRTGPLASPVSSQGAELELEGAPKERASASASPSAAPASLSPGGVRRTKSHNDLAGSTRATSSALQSEQQHVQQANRPPEERPQKSKLGSRKQSDKREQKAKQKQTAKEKKKQPSTDKGHSAMRRARRLIARMFGRRRTGDKWPQQAGLAQTNNGELAKQQQQQEQPAGAQGQPDHEGQLAVGALLGARSPGGSGAREELRAESNEGEYLASWPVCIIIGPR